MDFEGYAHTSFFSFKFPLKKIPLKFCFQTFSASSLHPHHLPCPVFQPFSSALPANLSPGSEGDVTLGWLLLLPAIDLWKPNSPRQTPGDKEWFGAQLLFAPGGIDKAVPEFCWRLRMQLEKLVLSPGGKGFNSLAASK